MLCYIRNMRIAKYLMSLAALISAIAAYAGEQNTAAYVNPLIGTKGIWFYGRTTPFVTPPFGMTDWTACTRNCRIRIPNYHYFDTRIRGFRATHKPAMWMGDYGYVTLKPFAGKISSKHLKQTLLFTHAGEKSQCYYYSVKTHTPTGKKIKTEITATSRCGMLRFTFGKKQQPSVYIEVSQLPDSLGWVKVDTARREIIGWNQDRHCAHLGPPLPNFKGYFVIRFNKPIEVAGTWVNDSISELLQQSANACGAWVQFKKGTEVVEARVGTSFISLEQARENLERETAGQTFEMVENRTKEEWNKYLSRIEVEATSNRKKKILYTALYHSLLFPREFSEYGRYYSAFDDTIHPGVSYNDYSLWDTYRAEHPLLILVAKEHVSGMVQSLVQMYKEGGFMPKWPNPTYTGIMIGTHADAVIADAVVKGVKGFDLKEAAAACIKDCMVPSAGDTFKRWYDRALWAGSPETRAGLTYYLRNGFVPVDKTAESVSNTLEGAYDDFCSAQVAKAAGNDSMYQLLTQHSKNYRNVYNQSTGMMAPRNSDFSWYKDTHAGFTEGGPYTYLFAVQHDIPGLMQLMGGREAFIKKLNASFSWHRYWHTNEPGHHYTYLYNYAGMPWVTQRKVAWFRSTRYRNNPDGMDGDDDCGQMSAWYVFSAMGFYPVTPGTDVYAIGSPQFKKLTLHPDPLNTNLKLEIIANHVSGRNKYIQSVTLNGKPVTAPFLHHAELIAGGQLIFEMGSKPNKQWGVLTEEEIQVIAGLKVTGK